jgi:hypothetical protein
MNRLTTLLFLAFTYFNFGCQDAIFDQELTNGIRLRAVDELSTAQLELNHEVLVKSSVIRYWVDDDYIYIEQRPEGKTTGDTLKHVYYLVSITKRKFDGRDQIVPNVRSFYRPGFDSVLRTIGVSDTIPWIPVR